MPLLLVFVWALDDTGGAFNLADSWKLPTAATQERRFCFAHAVGFGSVVTGLLQAVAVMMMVTSVKSSTFWKEQDKSWVLQF